MTGGVHGGTLPSTSGLSRAMPTFAAIEGLAHVSSILKARLADDNILAADAHAWRRDATQAYLLGGSRIQGSLLWRLGFLC